ncbi:MAG: ATP-binding protein [Bacteroidota bacterium]
MQTIRSKITLTYILLCLTVILLLGIVSSYELEQYFAEGLRTELKTETNILFAYLASLDARTIARSEAARTLRSMAELTNIRITLINSEGVVLFESSVPDSLVSRMENHIDRPEITQARLDEYGWNVRSSHSINLEMMYLARSFETERFNNTVFPGFQYLRVAVPATEISTRVSDIRTKIVIAGTGVFFIVLIVSLVIARRISSPLIEIGAIVQEIKSGNLARKLPVSTHDEIGHLAELINEMTEKLRDDIERLKKLERVRSEFLGNVSHELRTPIFSLKGYLETLLDGAIEDTSVNRTFLEKAYNHANRLDALLSDLIEISRIESGDMKMSFREFSVIEFLKQIGEEYGSVASRKNQSITVDYHSSNGTVIGDKERLHQAVGNIIDNALKYSQPGATVSLIMTDKPDHLRVSIADNGPGISAEHIPRIFERFYRIDRDRSREVGGTGLGLAIAKHIVEAHGSKIKVISIEGKGTEFYFDLKISVKNREISNLD